MRRALAWCGPPCQTVWCWFIAGLDFLSLAFRPRPLKLFIVPNLLIAATLYLVPTELLINLLNSALLSLSAGIAAAYAKPVFDIMTEEDGPLDRPDYLAAGILLGWTGGLLALGWNVGWRIQGRPDWMEVSPVISYARFMQCIGAACHMIARDALRRPQVPPSRWIKLGVYVAGFTFSLMIATYLLDRFGIIGKALPTFSIP